MSVLWFIVWHPWAVPAAAALLLAVLWFGYMVGRRSVEDVIAIHKADADHRIAEAEFELDTARQHRDRLLSIVAGLTNPHEGDGLQ